jgi:hypothetical protein
MKDAEYLYRQENGLFFTGDGTGAQSLGQLTPLWGMIANRHPLEI